ncbi:hypothetical protein [Rhodococcus rhodochrous]|uniref:Uncharacterized protein n=1 Tax=Rhodococcus rhodochrous KG-21 TaxID=1441923 RepID=A0A0M8PI58_RHORH|nr:hypothetical protein [Rhodococcus rhodochrous]KOS53172.1 hypothetical protein Z051_27045 [Rhodococcus rhodochrous KG-21]
MNRGAGGDDPARPDFSLGRLALTALGAATGVLLLATAVIVVLQPGPVVALIVALAGVVGAIAAMGVVSTRTTRRAFGRGGPDASRRGGPDASRRDGHDASRRDGHDASRRDGHDASRRDGDAGPRRDGDE